MLATRVPRWLSVTILLIPMQAFAADTTPPTTPVVTDDGAYTTSTTSLHATWTSSDAESGIAEYQYVIKQDSAQQGATIVTWTSTGTVASVTKTGLTLANGRAYYVGVAAKNGVGLWSATGYSNGITVDSTAPTAPGQPTENSATTDADYDGDGSYTVYWGATADMESGIAAYQIQERIGTTGTWTTLSSSQTTTNYAVTGRLHNTRYFYQVRAKNGAGTWGPWSVASDGVLIDTTAPSSVAVTDDGSTTTSTTQLHATWTTSSDSESGLADYQYQIRQDSVSGPIVVDYTSLGVATQVTRVGLSLVAGKTYYIGIRAQNMAGLWSSTAYTDGITVTAGDTLPPTGTITINTGAAYATTPSVTLTLSATDNSGTVSQMQFSNDNATYTTPEPYATTKAWTLSAGDGTKTVSVKFKDAASNWSSPTSDNITLDSTAPSVTITSPADGAVLGAP